MITRRNFIHQAGLGLAALAAPKPILAAEAKTRPNFVFILDITTHAPRPPAVSAALAMSPS